MLDFISFISKADEILWRYVCFSVIMVIGLVLSIKSNFYQFFVLRHAKRYIRSLIVSERSLEGVNPFRLYFASIAGMIGLGNIVAITTVITIGGPGGLFWLWIAFFIGMIVKYSEVYLGILYRQKNGDTYDGGPMYYLASAFSSKALNKILPKVAALLLCIYGVEILQFRILTDTFVEILHIDKVLAIGILLSLVLIATIGGVRKLSNICTALMPPFLIAYLLFGICVIAMNIGNLPSALISVLQSAFTGQAAVGGFAGSFMLHAIHQGFSRGVYSGDIAIGYDAIVQSETQIQHPEKQAVMAIFGIMTELAICSITLLSMLVTNIWTEALPANQFILKIMQYYLPNSVAEMYILLLFFIAGFTTIIGYFIVGQKCAYFLNKNYGKQIYICYAIIMYIVFAICDASFAWLIMSVCSGLLILVNLMGVYCLRNKIAFPKIVNDNNKFN